MAGLFGLVWDHNLLLAEALKMQGEAQDSEVPWEVEEKQEAGPSREVQEAEKGQEVEERPGAGHSHIRRKENEWQGDSQEEFDRRSEQRPAEQHGPTKGGHEGEAGPRPRLQDVTNSVRNKKFLTGQ